MSKLKPIIEAKISVKGFYYELSLHEQNLRV